MLKKKICMLGYYGVGKTSLVSRFVKQVFSDKYLTTVGVKIDKKPVVFGGHELDLMLWDLAGEEDDAPVNLKHLRGANGYLLVIDGCRRKTLDAAISIQQRVESEIGRYPFLVLANKADERVKWEIPDEALQELANRGWTVLETSAKTGQNVEEAFLQLAKEMLESPSEDRSEDGE